MSSCLKTRNHVTAFTSVIFRLGFTPLALGHESSATLPAEIHKFLKRATAARILLANSSVIRTRQTPEKLQADGSLGSEVALVHTNIGSNRTKIMHNTAQCARWALGLLHKARAPILYDSETTH